MHALPTSSGMFLANGPTVLPPAPPDETSPLPGLALRWSKARAEALRSVLALTPGLVSSEHGERALLALAWQADPVATLRQVFDYSRALGVSFGRYYRVDLTLVDPG